MPGPKNDAGVWRRKGTGMLSDLQIVSDNKTMFSCKLSRRICCHPVSYAASKLAIQAWVWERRRASSRQGLLYPLQAASKLATQALSCTLGGEQACDKGLYALSGGEQARDEGLFVYF